jgi:hypothetical protein
MLVRMKRAPLVKLEDGTFGSYVVAFGGVFRAIQNTMQAATR